MSKDAPWYKDGLCFECTQCGNCCTGDPGVVWVDENDITKIAKLVGKAVDEVLAQHTRRVGRRISLTERANGDCTFFDPKARRCRIYSARPAQCRTWPFWNSNIESQAAWKSIQPNCPGAGKGTLYSLEQIERQAGIIDV